MVIFRENTEDVYAASSSRAARAEAKKVIALLKESWATNVLPDGSGIGIKPMTPEGTKRLVRMAIRYAIDKKRPA